MLIVCLCRDTQALFDHLQLKVWTECLKRSDLRRNEYSLYTVGSSLGLVKEQPLTMIGRQWFDVGELWVCVCVGQPFFTILQMAQVTSYMCMFKDGEDRRYTLYQTCAPQTSPCKHLWRLDSIRLITAVWNTHAQIHQTNPSHMLRCVCVCVCAEY